MGEIMTDHARAFYNACEAFRQEHYPERRPIHGAICWRHFYDAVESKFRSALEAVRCKRKRNIDSTLYFAKRPIF